MRVVGEFGQDRGIIQRYRPEKALTKASNKSVAAAVSAKPEQQSGRSADIGAGPPAAVSDQGAKIAGDAGLTASLNFIGPVGEPAQKDMPVSEARAEQMTPTQIAVYPHASKDAWDMLLCSVSGQLLVTQTEALLKQRAALETLLRENRFNLDPPEKPEEWIAAEKEIRAIDREISKFKERSKAVIEGAAVN